MIPTERTEPAELPGVEEAKDAAARGLLTGLPRAVFPPTGFAQTSAANALGTGLGFDGLSEDGWIPPDVQVAAGPQNVVEMVNNEMGIWSTSGAAEGTRALSDFFGTGSDSISDPWVVYDTGSGRWFAAILDKTRDNLQIAASHSGDPTGAWSVWLHPWTINGLPVFLDQEFLGTSDSQVAMTANLYSLDGTQFKGTAAYVFSKAELVAGASIISYWYYYNYTGSLFSLRAAHSLGTTQTGWLAALHPGAASSVQLFAVTGTPPNAQVSSFTVPLGAAVDPPPQGSQPGGPAIDTGSTRLLDAVWQAGILYLTFNEACGDTDGTTISCAAVVAISTVTHQLLWRINIGGGGEDAFYPAAAPDPDRNVLVSFGVSSGTEYPSAEAAGIPAGGQTPLSWASVADGTHAINNDRYGDYFGAAVDPTHPHAVWLAGEVGNDPSGGWGSAIRAVSLDPEQAGVGAVTLAGAPSQTQATVSASIDPAGTDTSYTFQYGTTTAYGAQSGGGSIPGGTAPATETATLSRLAPGTTYHVRAVATNAAGTVYGPDATFTTASPPTPTRVRITGWRVQVGRGSSASFHNVGAGQTFSHCSRSKIYVLWAYFTASGPRNVQVQELWRLNGTVAAQFSDGNLNFSTFGIQNPGGLRDGLWSLAIQQSGQVIGSSAVRLALKRC